jgi:hypothetical protein
MSEQIDRVPKAQRLQPHRLKNAYRKVYRREPAFARPATEEAALQAIAFLEQALRDAGAPRDKENPKGVVPVPGRRRNRLRRPR